MIRFLPYERPGAFLRCCGPPEKEQGSDDLAKRARFSLLETIPERVRFTQLDTRPRMSEVHSAAKRAQLNLAPTNKERGGMNTAGWSHGTPNEDFGCITSHAQSTAATHVICAVTSDVVHRIVVCWALWLQFEDAEQIVHIRLPTE